MQQRHKSPETASAAQPAEGARLRAPAAARNGEAILAVLRRHGPEEGRALEIASGTGQHVALFARELPRLDWQPSEIDAARRASIAAWTDGITNVRPVIALDATTSGWGARHPDHDLILAVNLLHLIGTQGARTVIAEAARALAPGGRLVLYGPFLRAGKTTSEGDAQFHASLIQSDPAIGYKDDAAVIGWLQDAGLSVMQVVEMPANNLSLVATRPI